MDPEELVAEYSRGAEVLRRSITGLDQEQLDAVPVAGCWSVRQVVCHLADCELVYADRIKRVLAEDNPVVFGLCPDAFQQALFVTRRDVSDEIELIRTTRYHITSILTGIDLEQFHRTAVHSEDGPLTLETLLERITRHIPHHVRFIHEKRLALGVPQSE